MSNNKTASRRMTKQRQAIINMLAKSKEHPTAEMIYAAVRQELPDISLGTVYRNLNLLVGSGEIQKLSFGDGADHFDARTAPHYHFVCRCCHQVSDLPMGLLTEIDHLAQRYYDGKVESHATTFYGVCGDCTRKGAAPAV